MRTVTLVVKCLTASIAVILVAMGVALLKDYKGNPFRMNKMNLGASRQIWGELDRGEMTPLKIDTSAPSTSQVDDFSPSSVTNLDHPKQELTSQPPPPVVNITNIHQTHQHTTQNYNLQYRQYNTQVNVQQNSFRQYQTNVGTGIPGGYYPYSTPYYSSPYGQAYKPQFSQPLLRSSVRKYNDAVWNGRSAQEMRFRERQLDRDLGYRERR